MNFVFKQLLVFTLLSLVSAGIFAQSGRTGEEPGLDPETQLIADTSVSDLFTKASNYQLDKFTELEEKKAPYSEKLHREILQDQKKLAAKYAAQIATRKEIIGVENYYLGRLHWLAANPDGAFAVLNEFLANPTGERDKEQTARSIVVFVASEKKQFDLAERTLADYLANFPVSTSEIANMRKQLAVSYVESGQFGKASVHADAAFEATKTLLFERTSRAKALTQFQDAGITAFEIYRKLGETSKAENALVTLRKYAANVKSHSVYFRAVDEQIRYLLETNRRAEALMMYSNSFKLVRSEIADDSIRNAVELKLRKRDKHYKIIGQPAPELSSIDAYLPNKPLTLAGLKGKVVLIDFWATWCGPCFDAFPKLSKWHETLAEDGLVVLGLTRYYGESASGPVGTKGELAFLKEFKIKENLPYPFVIAEGQSNQINYGAMSLPTAVIIDRKGIVRFIESGTSDSREAEIEKMIRKLLDE